MKLALCIVLFQYLISLSSCYPADKKLKEGRIVGGENATIEDYPYMLSLQYFGNHQCGASALSMEWALTAAHCFGATDPLMDFLTVRAGTSKHNLGGSQHLVEKIIRHEQFQPTYDNDIALLKLKEPLVPGVVKPVRLPEPDAVVPDGYTVTALGWGLTSTGGSLSEQLQKVDVFVLFQEQCNEIMPDSFTDNMLCAGAPSKDSCNGDSGGPIVDGSIQLGIVSWGPTQCAHPVYPGVYTRLSKYTNWILNNTKLSL